MNEQTPSHDTPTNPASRDSVGLLRAALWSLLVLGAAGNMVASAASAGLGAHLALGAVTAAAAAGLIALWLKDRS